MGYTMTITNQMRLGTTGVVSDLNMLGQIGVFQDQDLTTYPGAPTINSGTPVYALLVMNDSGGTLLSGLGVTFKSAYIGKRVGALSGANAICDGIVDPALGAGITVADQAYFWLIIQGPCDVKASAGAITANAEVQTAANGLFTDGTAGTNPIGHVGKAVTAAAAAARSRIYFRSPFAAVKP